MRVLFSSIYPYLFLLLFVTIPFDNYLRAVPNILLIVLAVLFPIVVRKHHFAKIKLRPTLVWLGFFLSIVVIGLITNRWTDDMSVVNKILLSGALVLLYLPVDNFKKINKAIILSSLSAIVFSLVKLFILLNQGVSFSFLESASIIEALLIDRIYLGFLAVLSILVSYQLLRKEYHPDNSYYLANIVINVLFILFLVSRIAIVVLLLIFILSLFHNKKRGPQLLFATGSLLLLAALVFVLNKDLRAKMFYATGGEKQGLVANTLAYEPRTVIWDCALDIQATESIGLTGIGFAETHNKMIACYETKIEKPSKRTWFVEQRYNVHNQFLDLYLGSGLMVLVLFLTGIVVLFLYNRRSFFPSALLVTLVGFAMVENVFHRQIGAYYVGFILLSLLIHNVAPIESPTNKDEITQ